MSWWKFGHELGEQAEAGVVYTDITPSRVIETTSFFASELVSSVPREPSVGVATDPAAGQLRPGAAGGQAERRCTPRGRCEAVPATTSCLGASPVMSPTVSPVMNDRSLSTAGKPGENWPVFAFQRADEVLAALLVVGGERCRRARSRPAAGANMSRRGAIERAEGRLADRGEGGRVGLFVARRRRRSPARCRRRPVEP